MHFAITTQSILYSNQQITKHIYIDKHTIESQIERTKVLPYVLPIVTKYGVKGEHRKDKRGDYQEIVGKVQLNNGKKVCVTVIVADNGHNTNTIKAISVFTIKSGMIKALPTVGSAPTMPIITGTELLPSADSTGVFRLVNAFHSLTRKQTIPQSSKKSIGEGEKTTEVNFGAKCPISCKAQAHNQA